jgi:hypothetical protein
LGQTPQSVAAALLDFGFLVHNVLSNNRIKFLYFEFAGHGALVLCSRVKVAGTCRRHEFDLISHIFDPLIFWVGARSPTLET